MNKTTQLISRLAFLTFLPVLGGSMTLKAQYTTDCPSVTVYTSVTEGNFDNTRVGNMVSPGPDEWADLNGNGKYDDGEERGGKPRSRANGKLTYYAGRIRQIMTVGDNLTKIDVSKVPNVRSITVMRNEQMTSLDLSANAEVDQLLLAQNGLEDISFPAKFEKLKHIELQKNNLKKEVFERLLAAITDRSKMVNTKGEPDFGEIYVKDTGSGCTNDFPKEMVKAFCNRGWTVYYSNNYPMGDEEVIGEASGVQDIVSREFVAYPNPCVNDLTIGLPEFFVGKTIKIYNMCGVLVAQRDNAQAVNNLDVSALPMGVYIVKVANYSLKIVVKR